MCCGALIGYAAQEGIAYLLRDLVRGELPRPSLSAGWLGLMTSILILIGFALPPLLQLRKVPPARVLRRNLEPPPLRYAVVYGSALAALAAAVLARSRREVAGLRCGATPPCSSC